MGWEAVDWINLAQNRGQWRAVMNTIKNLRVSIKVWEFLNKLNNCWILMRNYTVGVFLPLTPHTKHFICYV
jgi:hypothetical protein